MQGINVTNYHNVQVTPALISAGSPVAFEKLLLDLALTKAQFAGIWGVSRETVSRWKSHVPQGVLIYLHLRRGVRNSADGLHAFAETLGAI